ncbi:CTL-like protein 1 [Fragariocoptes setiger]|uniref:Choline transporter-like protein n=1 Tax=Fragariocoptes setiger TaxID=1670756 RepID=A0ABQ7SDC6_9ACAR|nr:CTL-like protein 1 [Fragariocoptes setiger]
MGCFSCNEDENPDKNGRRCTDKFWLFLFALGWAILAAAAVWSFMLGNPQRLIHGYDSFGNICGSKNKPISGVTWSGIDMRDKPFVFHMDPTNVSFTMKVCVKACADKNLTNEGDATLFWGRTNSALFRYDYDPADKNMERFYRDSFSTREMLNFRVKDQQLGFGPIPKFPVAAQRPLLNRCVPIERIKLGNSFVNNVYSYIKNMEVPQKIVSDIYTSRMHIMYLSLLGLALSLLVVFTIHFLASIVSTIIMTLASILLVAMTAFSWYVYFDLRYKLNSLPSIQLDDDLVNEKSFFALSIVLTCISLVILIITFMFRQRLALMTALFNETASCIRSMPALVIQPLWTTIVLIIFLAFWTTVMLGVSTVEDEIVYDASTTRFKLALPAREIIWVNRANSSYRFSADTATVSSLESVKHKQPQIVKYLLCFLVLMLFWTSEFILGCQQMTISASVATWYFTRDKSQVISPICNSIRVVFYHMGTIALGSMLMVLFKIPRLILCWLENQLKPLKEKYACVNCTLKCCHCCFYLLDKFMRYINNSALSVTAIEGTSYCLSARVAFETISSNLGRIATIETVGRLIIFLGKVIVTSVVIIVGVQYIRFDQSIHFIAVPIVFSALVAYLIANSMLSIYEVCLDTMFLCYAEDVKKNVANPDGLYAPDSLIEFARGDLQNLKPGTPMIAQENNPISSQPRSVDMDASNGNGKPIGFIYPTQVIESTH